MSKLTKALTAAAGNAGGDNLYVEDVFSTYLYTGTGSAQTITNGIDLAGEGGLVWIKDRESSSRAHHLFDSEHLAAPYYNQYLSSNDADAIYSATGTGNGLGGLFNDNGFPVQGNHSTSGVDYASWTFRKAEKFFDVVTYTGDGSVSRDIPHSLNSVPACIIVKRTSSTENWTVYHQELNGGTTPYNWSLRLNSTNAEAENGDDRWVQPPTSTNFTVGDQSEVNTSGQTYVAYLFASDAGGFGDDGDESIIKCGSFSGGIQDVDLGFEPQFLIYKRTDSTGGWAIFDVMRGMTADGVGEYLQANTSDAEASGGSQPSPIANGFRWNYSPTGETYIYIAIRRPMKTPESGTEVFNDTFQYGEDGKTAGYLGSPADLDIRIDRTGGGSLVRDRLRGDLYLRTQATDAEAGSQSATWDNMTGYFYYSPGTSANTNIIHYVFKRATGFFDVVAYTGDGVNPSSIPHNLNVIPEMIIIKKRSTEGNWWTWVNGLTDNATYARNLQLSETDAEASNNVFYKSSDQSSTAFKIGAGFNGANDSGATYIAYLFATVAGVSKVGSYTGTGSNVNVDCGFSAGARFILIKRTDSTGDWYVWDSVRGIVAGNDPYLLLNTTAAEVTSTDYIDPLASGFTVTSSAPAALNASGGTYIFLAIA